MSKHGFQGSSPNYLYSPIVTDWIETYLYDRRFSLDKLNNESKLDAILRRKQV